MTPARLRDCLSILHWTQRDLARVLTLQRSQVDRWASGRYEVPWHVAAWLERLVQCHEENPPPMRNNACDVRQFGA